MPIESGTRLEFSGHGVRDIANDLMVLSGMKTNRESQFNEFAHCIMANYGNGYNYIAGGHSLGAWVTTELEFLLHSLFFLFFLILF